MQIHASFPGAMECPCMHPNTHSRTDLSESHEVSQLEVPNNRNTNNAM